MEEIDGAHTDRVCDSSVRNKTPAALCRSKIGCVLGQWRSNAWERARLVGSCGWLHAAGMWVGWFGMSEGTAEGLFY